MVFPSDRRICKWKLSLTREIRLNDSVSRYALEDTTFRRKRKSDLDDLRTISLLLTWILLNRSFKWSGKFPYIFPYYLYIGSHHREVNSIRRIRST